MMPTLKLIPVPEAETDSIPITRGEAPRPARRGRLVGLDSIREVERSIDDVERRLAQLDELAEETCRFDREDDGPRAA